MYIFTNLRSPEWQRGHSTYEYRKQPQPHNIITCTSLVINLYVSLSPYQFLLGNPNLSPAHHSWISTGRKVVFYELIKWEIQIRCIYECRCDERLQTKTKEFTHLTYTGLVVQGERYCLLWIDEAKVKYKTYVWKVYIVYYESMKREPKIRGIYECRCDERLQTKTKEFTRLPYTGLVLELEHLKIETRLINERFVNAMGEC
jgi:hypothetical protein